MHLDNIPVFPGGHGFFGHTAELKANRLGLMDRCAKAGGELVRLRDRFVPVLVANSPDMVQEVLVDKAHTYDKAQLFRWALYPLGGEGLFTAREPIWRGQRKLMAPLFHPKIVDGFADAMVACADRTLSEFKDGEVREIAHDTTKLTMAVAGKTLFDADTFSEADEIGNALTVALQWTSANAPSALSVGHIMTRRYMQDAAKHLPAFAAEKLETAASKMDGPLFTVGKSGRDLDSAIAVLDTRVQRMIQERREAASPPNDLLSKLLFARDDDQRGMTDKQVRDEVLTLFIAGHETTAAGLAWSLYLLCRHPEAYAKAKAEAAALVAPPTAQDLPKLGYLGRVFKEALRMYPPVYIFSRQAMKPTTLGGFDVPKDTVVLISPYALHRREAEWPNPTAFDPDRFLPEKEAKRSRYAWLPFGAGPRVCIGMQFAMMEAQLVLARFLQRADFELAGDEQVMTESTLRPKYHMRMRVRLRA
jgi:cytochrome P450